MMLNLERPHFLYYYLFLKNLTFDWRGGKFDHAMYIFFESHGQDHSKFCQSCFMTPPHTPPPLKSEWSCTIFFYLSDRYQDICEKRCLGDQLNGIGTS